MKLTANTTTITAVDSNRHIETGVRSMRDLPDILRAAFLRKFQELEISINPRSALPGVIVWEKSSFWGQERLGYVVTDPGSANVEYDEADYEENQLLGESEPPFVRLQSEEIPHWQSLRDAFFQWLGRPAPTPYSPSR
jgi:hypothetical protein